jgi:hypothetical protein
VLKFRLCTLHQTSPMGYLGFWVSLTVVIMPWIGNPTNIKKQDRQIWLDRAQFHDITKFSSISTHVQTCHNTGTNITYSLCDHITLRMFSLQQKDGSLLQTERNQSHQHLHLCCKNQEVRWGGLTNDLIPQYLKKRLKYDKVTYEFSRMRALEDCWILWCDLTQFSGWDPSIFRNFHPV